MYSRWCRRKWAMLKVNMKSLGNVLTLVLTKVGKVLHKGTSVWLPQLKKKKGVPVEQKN